MGQKILISTTNTLEGMEIEKYFDLISTNVVLGTNVFSDIGASFSDFFGGTSEIYQNKLERIYRIALDKLRFKAESLNANGIVGVNIDFDEVSGGGKSMFMISLTGMAVQLKFLKKEDGKRNVKPSSVSPKDLKDIINRIKIISTIKEGKFLDDNDWDYLIENTVEESFLPLLQNYLEKFKDNFNPITDVQKKYRKYFPLYLKSLDFDLVSKNLFENILENSFVIQALIKEAEAFSPEFTLDLIKNDKINLVFGLLEADKRFYTIEDLTNMLSILSCLKELPNTGKIELVKGLLGTKEKFICENNHQNDVNEKYCGNCEKNIKGLVPSQVNQINEFEIKVEGLKMLLG